MPALIIQFLRFGIVGLSGFAIDTATVYALRGVFGLLGAGAVAYLVAATSNWALNRSWTFASAPPAPAARQWGVYLMANAVGFVINRGVYALCLWRIPMTVEYPVVALAAGTGAGLALNFVLSRHVFLK